MKKGRDVCLEQYGRVSCMMVSCQGVSRVKVNKKTSEKNHATLISQSVEEVSNKIFKTEKVKISS